MRGGRKGEKERVEHEAAQLRGPSPGAVPLPPCAWHMPEHRSNQDSLGTGAGQVLSQASGCCSLSNSYTCSSWTRLSSANSPRPGEEKRKQRQRGREQQGGKGGGGCSLAGRSLGGWPWWAAMSGRTGQEEGRR